MDIPSHKKDIPQRFSDKAGTIAIGKLGNRKLANSPNYEETLLAIQSTDGVDVLETGKKNHNKYILQNCKDKREFMYTVWLNYTDICFTLKNNVSEKSARDCFDKLQITLA